MTEKDEESKIDNQEVQDKKEEASHQAKSLYESVKYLLRDYFSLKDLSEPELTIQGIKKDIEFKGFNIWILIFSILICSIGLNTNSGAVIIGAMLISPLMGPIMGMGMSVGINDFETLKKSFKSLMTAIIVAVFTSFVFFSFVPLASDYSELFARTRPDIRDVFIGLFGGLTGILAGSRKEKTNVIPGVAIATALMPPLCTAGYGLATGNLNFFMGAFYLFLINSFFISLSTLLVVRYLKFPVASFLSKELEKKGKRIIVIFTLIMIVPSIWIFVMVIQDTLFEKKAYAFVEEHVVYEGTVIRNEDIFIEYSDSIRVIQIFPIGEKIPQEVIDTWQRNLDKNIENTKLKIVQNGEEALALKEELGNRIALIEGANRSIYEKDEEIVKLKGQVSDFEDNIVPESLGAELLKFDPLINKVDFGKVQSQSYGGSKTKYIAVSLFWSKDSLLQDEERLSRVYDFLKVRLAKDSIQLNNY